jgi:HPt (histidine-containing phosphotransfer) domain-containing protein
LSHHRAVPHVTRTQIKDEAQREQFASNQVIEATASEVTAANHQVQHQVALRKRLEESIRELERNVEAERQNHTGNWEEQTNHLLDSIQKECNLAFDRNKAASTNSSTKSSTSPRTVLAEFADEEKRVERDQFQSSWSTSTTTMLYPSTSTGMSTEVGASPQSYNMSELDRALDETEAIVRSLCSEQRI